MVTRSDSPYGSTMSNHRLSPIDRIIVQLDHALRTTFGQVPPSQRPNPAAGIAEAPLSEAQRREAGRLMRVNHAGEVSAQALYQGQALTARLGEVRDKMERASQEENDHLAWCEQRTQELGAHTSYLNPLWYAGSFAIGAMAGAVGDRWSLGFVAETERQVVRHLEAHLSRLPPEDDRSRAILEQMKIDEAHHATVALEAGGADLPNPIKRLMGLVSQVMTGSAYWL